MKIECSGPNGETFEAKTEPVSMSTYEEMAKELDKQALHMQKALETWCEAFKVKQ